MLLAKARAMVLLPDEEYPSIAIIMFGVVDAILLALISLEYQQDLDSDSA